MLVVVNDNEKQQFIAAFNKDTGEQVWRTGRSIRRDGADIERVAGDAVAGIRDGRHVVELGMIFRIAIPSFRNQQVGQRAPSDDRRRGPT